MTVLVGDFLLVHTGARQVGLRLEDVVEVNPLGEVHQVPTSTPALRGVTRARDRLVPVLHLGALLGASRCPAEHGSTMVLARLAGHSLGLEVDEADLITRQELVPVPAGESVPWALAMVRGAKGLIPILNLNAFREQLLEAGAKHDRR